MSPPGRRRSSLPRPLQSSLSQGGVRLGDAIQAWIRSLRLEERAELNPLEQEWTSMVGAAFAAHSRPGPLESSGDMTVYVDNSVWLSEMERHARAGLLANLQTRFGKAKIRGVRLRLDPGR
jgi:hypothetical protein